MNKEKLNLQETSQEKPLTREQKIEILLESAKKYYNIESSNKKTSKEKEGEKTIEGEKNKTKSLFKKIGSFFRDNLPNIESFLIDNFPSPYKTHFEHRAFKKQRIKKIYKKEKELKEMKAAFKKAKDEAGKITKTELTDQQKNTMEEEGLLDQFNKEQKRKEIKKKELLKIAGEKEKKMNSLKDKIDKMKDKREGFIKKINKVLEKEIQEKEKEKKYPNKQIEELENEKKAINEKIEDLENVYEKESLGDDIKDKIKNKRKEKIEEVKTINTDIEEIQNQLKNIQNKLEKEISEIKGQIGKNLANLLNSKLGLREAQDVILKTQIDFLENKENKTKELKGEIKNLKEYFEYPSYKQSENFKENKEKLEGELKKYEKYKGFIIEELSGYRPSISEKVNLKNKAKEKIIELNSNKKDYYKINNIEKFFKISSIKEKLEDDEKISIGERKEKYKDIITGEDIDKIENKIKEDFKNNKEGLEEINEELTEDEKEEFLQKLINIEITKQVKNKIEESLKKDTNQAIKNNIEGLFSEEEIKELKKQYESNKLKNQRKLEEIEKEIKKNKKGNLNKEKLGKIKENINKINEKLNNGNIIVNEKKKKEILEKQEKDLEVVENILEALENKEKMKEKIKKAEKDEYGVKETYEFCGGTNYNETEIKDIRKTIAEKLGINIANQKEESIPIPKSKESNEISDEGDEVKEQERLAKEREEKSKEEDVVIIGTLQALATILNSEKKFQDQLNEFEEKIIDQAKKIRSGDLKIDTIENEEDKKNISEVAYILENIEVFNIKALVEEHLKKIPEDIKEKLKKGEGNELLKKAQEEYNIEEDKIETIKKFFESDQEKNKEGVD